METGIEDSNHNFDPKVLRWTSLTVYNYDALLKECVRVFVCACVCVRVHACARARTRARGTSKFKEIAMLGALINKRIYRYGI